MTTFTFTMPTTDRGFGLQLDALRVAMVEKRCYFVEGVENIALFCEAMGTATCSVCGWPHCALHMAGDTCVGCAGIKS